MKSSKFVNFSFHSGLPRPTEFPSEDHCKCSVASAIALFCVLRFRSDLVKPGLTNR